MPDESESIAQLLKRCGNCFSLRTVTTGQECQAALAEQAFAVAICMLSELQADTFREIWTSQATKPPLVGLCERWSDEVVLEALRWGATPVSLSLAESHLREVIGRILDAKPDHREWPAELPALSRARSNCFLDDVVVSRPKDDHALISAAIYEQLFLSALETLYVVGFSESGDYMTLAVNDAFLHLSGLAREDVVGRLLKDYIPHSTLSEMYGHYERAIRERRTVHYYAEVTYPAGDICAAVSVTPIFDAHGRCQLLVGSINDLTEKTLAKRKIAEQQTWLDQARDAILAWDEQGLVQYWNAGASRVYGWTQEEGLGRSVCELIRPADMRQFQEACDSLAKHGGWLGELNQRAKDGKELVVECSWTLVRDEVKETSYVLGINTDITDKKKLEERIVLAQRMESLRELADGIAHDFNNILTVIIGNVGLVRRGLPAEHVLQKKLSLIQDAGSKATDLAQQILTLSHGRDLPKILIDPRFVIEQALRLLRASLPPSVQIQTEFASERLRIRASPSQIHQLVVELGANAAHAMTKQGGHLEIGVDKVELTQRLVGFIGEAPPGACLLLSIADDGRGFDEAGLKRLFEPVPSKSDGQSIELGLSRVPSILRNHQGALTVESAPGLGSRFRIYLPFVLSQS